MSDPLPLAIPECTLSASALGPQIQRYRQLARHVIELRREIGAIRVRFDEAVPNDVLRRTLAVEQECCTFVRLDYDFAQRTLALTVANVDQDSRLDSLAALLTR